MASLAILIPAFNSVKTIGTTLESVQSQGTALTQVSAVYLADDCSTDHTISEAEVHWKAPIPLYILKGEHNLGERGNVNRAIAIVKKRVDWFLLLHSDDIAKSNWLQMMLDRVEACSQRVGSICSSWDVLLPDDSVIPGEDDLRRPIEVIEGTAQAIQGTLLRGCWWHISGCAIRMSAFEDIGGFDSQLPQKGDWEWLLRCLYKKWSVEYIPRTLILYRQHETSISSKSLQYDRDIRESLKIIRQYTWVLSKNDLLTFHFRRVKYAIRRILRALTLMRIRRILLACDTLGLVGWNCLQCLQKKFIGRRTSYD